MSISPWRWRPPLAWRRAIPCSGNCWIGANSICCVRTPPSPRQDKNRRRLPKSGRRLQIKKYNASFLPFFMFFATLGEDEIPSSSRLGLRAASLGVDKFLLLQPLLQGRRRTRANPVVDSLVVQTVPCCGAVKPAIRRHTLNLRRGVFARDFRHPLQAFNHHLAVRGGTFPEVWCPGFAGSARAAAFTVLHSPDAWIVWPHGCITNASYGDQ